MSGLILPNRFTSQPPASTLVDQAKAKELGVVYLAVANESGMLRDVIGGKDIVNPGGSSTGHTGRVWTFSGAQQSNKAITLTGEANLFVCARIKATAAQAGVPGAAFGVYNSGAQSGFGVGFSGSNQVGLAWLTNSGAGIDAYSTGALNAWYDVYTNLEFASVGKRAWINGRPATTTQGSSVSNWITGQNEIAVGAQHRSSGFLRNFTGHIEWAAVLILDNAKIDDALSARLYADRFPYNLFKSQSRRIWVAAAGGGDATATITGVSGSAQVGTVSTSGNASVSLPGASGAGSVGNVVASVSAATAITGVNGAGQVGNTTQTGAANVAVSTVAGTGQVGTVSASGSGSPDGNVTITGIAGTGQVGTLAAAGNAAVPIAGISGAGNAGSVVASVAITAAITGVSGAGSVGTTAQTGTANVTVSSATGTGSAGTVSATGTSQDGNAVISGISGIGSVGIVSANDGTVVNNHGFIIIDTEPRLWWKRKPSKLDDKKAEEKIFKVARVIERVVKHVANSNEPSVSKEVYRKAAYAEVAPLLREMPGFDWSPMFRAILTQSKLQEQNRIAAEQAGILAKQEIERIKRIRDDEEALIVLLMGA